MSMSEYNARMFAHALQNVDEKHRVYEQAWANAIVKATDKEGKPIFSDFKDFFDYKEEIKKIYSPEVQEQAMDQELVRRAKRLQEFRAKGGNV